MKNESLLAWDELQKKATVEERPFISHTPVIGPIIVWFRTQWNQIATKWYLRPLIAQQNEFNHLLLAQLQQISQQLYQIESRLISQDREQVNHTHDLGELTTQLIQTNRLLQDLNQRLTHLESSQE